MNITTNLFQIYSNNGTQIKSFSDIKNEINNVVKLIDEDICEGAILETDPDYFSPEYLNKLENKLTFNVTDLIPMETLRRSADSLACELAKEISPVNDSEGYNTDSTILGSPSESEVEEGSNDEMLGGANNDLLPLTVENQLNSFIDAVSNSGIYDTSELEIYELDPNEEVTIDYTILNNIANLIIYCLEKIMLKKEVSSKTENNNTGANLGPDMDVVDSSDKEPMSDNEGQPEGPLSDARLESTETHSNVASEHNLLDQKYLYNKIFYYSFLYYVTFEYLFGDVEHLTADETNLNYQMIAKRAEMYIYTYIILLQLMPNIITYSSSSKIREYLGLTLTSVNQEGLTLDFLNNIDNILKHYWSEDYTPNLQQNDKDNILTLICQKLFPNTQNNNNNNNVNASGISTGQNSSPQRTPSQSSQSTRSQTISPQLYKLPPPSKENQLPGSKVTVVSMPQFGSPDDVTSRFSQLDNGAEPKVTPSDALSSNLPPSSNALKIEGGSCKHIDLRNELLSVKFLFEWSHDFGPSRALDYVNGDYLHELNKDFYTETGIFQTIIKGWDEIIKNEDPKKNSNKYTGKDIEVDTVIFEKLSAKDTKHEESTYVYNIIDALMTYCSNMKSNLLYIPITEFTYKNNTDNNDYKKFFENIFKYYGNQRMFMKPDDTTKNIHLSVINDNTELGQIPPTINFGKNMQDMNLDPMALALIIERYNLYKAWDEFSNTKDTNQKINSIFNDFQPKTNPLIDKIKNTGTQQIKTVAKMLDPLPAGQFEIEKIENYEMIKQDFEIPTEDAKKNFNNALKVATIYGINQLFNVWINENKTIADYDYKLDNANKIAAINFYENSSNNSFTWYYNESTVNIICGALINVRVNLGLKFNVRDNDKNRYNTKISYDKLDEIFSINNNFATSVSKRVSHILEYWQHIYNIVKFIINHPKFRYVEENQNKKEVSVKIILMIIAYLKSCGDEYQRLTCEAINYLLDGKQEYLIDNATFKIGDVNATQDSQATQLEPETQGKSYENNTIYIKDLQQLLGNNVFFLTKDRILIGESIEKDTPLFTNLKTPHDAFYDDVKVAEDFYNQSEEITGKNLTKKGIGLMSNRRDILSTKAELNYGEKYEENKNKIKDLFKAIILKTNPEYYGKTDIHGQTIEQIFENGIEYYVKLQYNINENKVQNNEVNAIISNNFSQDKNKDLYDKLSQPSQLLDETQIESQNQYQNEMSSTQTLDEYPTAVIDPNVDKKKYEIQMDIISDLSKLLLALEYYNAASATKLKAFYETCIDAEISKAISSTIDSSMIKMITMQNSCNLPANTKSLYKLLEQMVDDLEAVDKLLESYDKANEMFISKLEMYKKIIENFDLIKNKGTDLDQNTQLNISDLMTSYLNNIFGENIRKDVITKYNDYLTYIESTKNLFGENFKNTIKLNMDAEANRMKRSRTTSNRTSYAETDNLDEMREKIISDLNDLFSEKEKIEEEKARTTAEIARLQSEPPVKTKKTLVQGIKDALNEAKKIIQAGTKTIKGLDKTLKAISVKIQKFTEKKQQIEIKAAQRTKVIGYESLKQAYEYLLGRGSTPTPATVEIPTGSDNININENRITGQKRKTADTESEVIQQEKKGGKTLKQKRRHYFTKRAKLTNNKKHTKYMKKKILRKTRTK